VKFNLGEYKLIENTSKKYYNRSMWINNDNDKFIIIGKTNRYYIYNNRKMYNYYLCEFADNIIIETRDSCIRLGTIKNPFHLSILGIGYIGRGKWVTTNNGKHTKEYQLFINILKRCYDPKSNNYKDYGNKGITLENELLCFQNFCEMLVNLINYDKWKNDKNRIWELDKDVLCNKLNISPKIYSKDTCQFILKKDNISERNKRVLLTGKTYIGISPNQEEIEFTNIKEFSRKYSLNDRNIGNCIHKRAKTHKGWTFKIKEK